MLHHGYVRLDGHKCAADGRRIGAMHADGKRPALPWTGAGQLHQATARKQFLALSDFRTHLALAEIRSECWPSSALDLRAG